MHFIVLQCTDSNYTSITKQFVQPITKSIYTASLTTKLQHVGTRETFWWVVKTFWVNGYQVIEGENRNFEGPKLGFGYPVDAEANPEGLL